MKFYVSATLKDAAKAREIMTALEKTGDKVTYDWTATFDWKNPNLNIGRKEATKLALDELEGVTEANYLVYLTPGGRGTHIELGVALAFNTPVFMIGEHPEPTIFYELMTKTTMDTYITDILKWKAQNFNAPKTEALKKFLKSGM